MANHQFFQNKACEYFPCHKVKEEEFNCLFCFCPLYGLKDQCGGNFAYLENGIKSCMGCTKPHTKDGYDHIMSHMKEVMELGKRSNQSSNRQTHTKSMSAKKRGTDDATD